MALPFFYHEQLAAVSGDIQLDDENSRHIVSVLRIRPGEMIRLTDGLGNEADAELINDHKKHCVVRVKSSRRIDPSPRRISISISLTKNSSRFEWFLEKATEIGVSRIVPLICERTAREKFRFERMKGICISAMIQSQQSWLPELQMPVGFNEFINEEFSGKKFIAHCADESKTELAGEISEPTTSACILIGPEGDFTNNEIHAAIEKGFKPVQLGDTRLRTETAGIVAATLLLF